METTVLTISEDRKVNHSLSEAPQVSTARFSLFQREGDIAYQSSTYFKCKDYLNDVLYAIETGRTIEAHGFSFNPKKQKIDTDATRLLITFKQEDELKHFKNNFPKLNEWETKIGIIPTKLYATNREGEYAIEGDPGWQKRMFLLSAYTLFLRSLGCPIPSVGNVEYIDWMAKNKQSCDQYLFANLMKKDRLFKFMQKPLEFLKEDHGVLGEKEELKGKLGNYTVHNCGIMAFLVDPGTYSPRYSKLHEELLG